MQDINPEYFLARFLNIYFHTQDFFIVLNFYIKVGCGNGELTLALGQNQGVNKVSSMQHWG